MFFWSYTMYLYTSSLTTHILGCSRTTPAMASSSDGLKTVPVGLCGVFTMIALVLGVTTLRIASTSTFHLPSSSFMAAYTGTPPAILI